MPESAEVKLTTEFLHSALKNKMVNSWKIIDGQYSEVKPSGYDVLCDNMPMLVESVKCKGKFIYFTLYNEYTKIYVFHSMRLTGKWQTNKDKYCKWYIELENNKKIWFKNPKCLATLEFTTEKDELDDVLERLGPDILTEEFNLPLWKNLVNDHKNKNITSFLMNQNIISGIGNYIKAEVLYYANISPLRKTGSLSKSEIEKLFEAIRIIPRISYNKGGFDKYITNGSYKEDLKIYGKKEAKKIKTSDGRVTYWDPSVQV